MREICGNIKERALTYYTVSGNINNIELSGSIKKIALVELYCIW